MSGERSDAAAFHALSFVCGECGSLVGRSLVLLPRPEQELQPADVAPKNVRTQWRAAHALTGCRGAEPGRPFLLRDAPATG